MTDSPRVYVSIDIETNGPCPGSFSMLSLGAAAFTLNHEVPFEFFYGTLQPLLRAGADPKTMDWWAGHREAYEEVTRDPKPAGIVIDRFYRWLVSLPDEYPIACAYPAAWDMAFVHWYMMNYVGRNPLGHSAIDIKTLASVLLKRPYRTIGKKHVAKLVGDLPEHKHHALGDAIEQGVILVRLMRMLERRVLDSSKFSEVESNEDGTFDVTISGLKEEDVR